MEAGLKLEGNKLGVAVKGLTESRKNRLAEALEAFISVDNARALVSVGQYNKVVVIEG